MTRDTYKNNCSKCRHSAVCMLKETVLSAQETVNEMTIPISEDKTVRLADIDYIKPVEIMCRYWEKKPESTIR